MLTFKHISKESITNQRKFDMDQLHSKKREKNKNQEMQIPFHLFLQPSKNTARLEKGFALNIVDQEQLFTKKLNNFDNKLEQKYICFQEEEQVLKESNKLEKQKQTKNLQRTSKEQSYKTSDLYDPKNQTRLNKENIKKHWESQQKIDISNKKTKEILIEKKQFNQVLEKLDKGSTLKNSDEESEKQIKNTHENIQKSTPTEKKQLNQALEKLDKDSSLKNSDEESKKQIKNTHENIQKPTSAEKKQTFQKKSNTGDNERSSTVEKDTNLKETATSFKENIDSTSNIDKDKRIKYLNKKGLAKKQGKNIDNKNQNLQREKINNNRNQNNRQITNSEEELNSLSQIKMSPTSALSTAGKVIHKRVQTLLKDVNNQQIKDIVTTKIDKMISRSRLNIRNAKFIDIETQLYPKELGKISLNLSMQNNILYGKFLVENEVVQNILNEKMQELVEQFKKEGYSVGDFSVDVQDQSRSNKSKVYEEEIENIKKNQTLKNSTNLNANLIDKSNTNLTGGIYA